MAVEALIQGSEYCPPDFRYRICNTDCKKLLYNTAHDLYRVMACLINNRVYNVKLTAGQGCSFSNFRALVFDVLDGHITNKLVKDVAYDRVSTTSVENLIFDII